MGQNYEQLSLKNVVRLPGFSQAGKTIRQIAAALDRAPSTIARELKRNSGTQVGYQPAYAEQQAKSRRWRGSRLLRKPAQTRSQAVSDKAGRPPKSPDD